MEPAPEHFQRPPAGFALSAKQGGATTRREHENKP